LLRDANQIFNPKSSNRLEGSNHEKLSEADILNQLRLNDPSISDEVLQKIDSRLDTSQKSFQKLSDVKVVVLETNLQNQNDPGAHSRIVSSIAQNNNSNLKPENIIHLGLREAGGTVEGLKSAADLSRRIQSEGGKPPVVNMSLEVGSMTDLNPDNTGIASVGDIPATALGYPANVTAGEMAKDPADLRRRLTELANKGDANAKQTLAEADALLELADTGAKVDVAWGNKDKVNLVGIITQQHPNITFVSAVDGHNSPSTNLNATTGQFAEKKLRGNVVLVPEEFKGQVDPKSVDGATVIYSPMPSSFSLAGQNPEKFVLNISQVEPPAKQVSQNRALTDSYYLRKSVVEAVDSINSTGQVDPIQIEMLLNNRESLDKALQKSGLPPLGNERTDEKLTTLLKNPADVNKRVNYLNGEVKANTPQANTPQGNSTVNDETLERLSKEVTAPLKDRFVTPEQYTKIFGTQPPKGVIPSDSKGDASVYLRLTHPETAVSGYPGANTIQTYQAVRLNNGQTILVVPTEGTSFAAPIQTGIDSK